MQAYIVVHWAVIKYLVLFSCSSTGASLIHSFFPPWDADAFRPFPTFQKYYRALIYVAGYWALNMRSTIYKSISIYNPNGKNAPKVPE